MASYFQNIKRSFKWKHYINYTLVAAFLFAFMILQSSGALKRSVANLAAQIGFAVILAVSLNLVVGFLGELSLGHAGFMCVGAYLGTFLSGILREIMPPLPALILAMLAGGLFAAIFGFAVAMPALRLKGDYLAIVTLAFGEIVRNIFKNLPFFGGATGLDTKRFGEKLYIVALVAVLLMLFVVQNLVRSKHGRAITAIRDNEIAARAMGINVTYYKVLVFVIAAFFAGVAGVLYGATTTPVLYSFFSYNYSIEILVMVVLGGMGSITGSILSASLITVINHMLTKNLSGDLASIKYLIYALILMLVVIFNNAPALRPIKERFSPKKAIERLRERIFRPSPEKAAADIRDDASAWDRIPTKIEMNEVLSTDIANPEGSIREKGDSPKQKS